MQSHGWLFLPFLIAILSSCESTTGAGDARGADADQMHQITHGGGDMADAVNAPQVSTDDGGGLKRHSSVNQPFQRLQRIPCRPQTLDDFGRQQSYGVVIGLEVDVRRGENAVELSSPHAVAGTDCTHN